MPNLMFHFLPCKLFQTVYSSPKPCVIYFIICVSPTPELEDHSMSMAFSQKTGLFLCESSQPKQQISQHNSWSSFSSNALPIHRIAWILHLVTSSLQKINGAFMHNEQVKVEMHWWVQTFRLSLFYMVIAQVIISWERMSHSLCWYE